MPTAKTTFTLAEAAALLSCHSETLRRAIRDGKLRAAKLGKSFRISRSDLESFWSASGGGELFEKSAPEPVVEPAPAAPAKAAEPVKKKPELLQLTLLPGLPVPAPAPDGK